MVVIIQKIELGSEVSSSLKASKQQHTAATKKAIAMAWHMTKWSENKTARLVRLCLE